ncbi:MAG TPA: dihydropteroate synthase [Bacteroidales bacterium]|nr:dihydropteroate synthase [Bacteroidales bacterium]
MIRRWLLDRKFVILDRYTYSSRPGADDISVEEEGKRLFKSLKLLNKEIPDAVCSVDTFRSSIAREAVAALIKSDSVWYLFPA